MDKKLQSTLLADPAVSDWVAVFLDTGAPPGIAVGTKSSYIPLGGIGRPVTSPRYVCPVDGLYVWFRRSVSQSIPACPDHAPELLVLEGGA